MENCSTGIFSMDVVHQILKVGSLEEAKKLAKDAIVMIVESGKKVRVCKKCNEIIDRS